MKKNPEFWDEIFQKYAKNVVEGKKPSNLQEQAIIDHGIGDFGNCIDDQKTGKCRYLTGGEYKGGKMPEELSIYEFSKGDWAVFLLSRKFRNATRKRS